ncbi:MAG: glutamate--tRNA ligase [Schleiferiaceae bacterium]|nr:glutamate--tRNA ligase [Schleiferiaceae bacterium]
MTARKVRVRFAPSPTGPLHMGGVRTALYNYLFAKKHNGDFLIRVEDTDQTRYVPGAEAYIMEALTWCGMQADESTLVGGPHAPYRQSERKAIYRQYVDQLLANDKAYYAFDTSEELDRVRELSKAAGNAGWQYNHVTRSSMRNSLTLPKEETERLLESGEPFVVRIKLPRNEEVKFHDVIRGWVSVNTNHMDDKVLYKSDGMPTYHMANIVDDHLMEITHVIRGEEWLPSAPLHVLLYKYLDWECPIFAHLPLLLKPDGNGKLSKRDGDRLGFPVFPLEWTNPENGEVSSGYRERGFLPEAFINMLAFLGWNPGTSQELFSMSELIAAFDLERVGKAGAKYDFEKAKWFNQQYIKHLSHDAIGAILHAQATDAKINVSLEICVKAAPLVQERAVFTNELLEEGQYLFEAPTSFDEKTVTKKWNADSPAIIGELREAFEAIENWTSNEIEVVFKAFLNEKKMGFGQVGPLFRLTVTGKGAGASLFDICEIIGKEETLKRLKDSTATLATL